MAIWSLQLFWYGIVSTIASQDLTAFGDFDNLSNNRSTDSTEQPQMTSNFNESIVFQRSPVYNSSYGQQSENKSLIFGNFSFPGSKSNSKADFNKTVELKLSIHFLERNTTEDMTIHIKSRSNSTLKLPLELNNSTSVYFEETSPQEKAANRTVEENEFLSPDRFHKGASNMTSFINMFKNSNNTLSSMNSSISLNSSEAVRDNSTLDTMLTERVTESRLYTVTTYRNYTLASSTVRTNTGITRSTELTPVSSTNRNRNFDTVTLKPSGKHQQEAAIHTLLLQGLRHGIWKHREPLQNHPLGSLVWRDKKYLISVLVPIGVGITGSVVIVIVAFVIRSYRRREKRRAFKSPNRIFRPQAQLAIMDNVLLLDDSSDDGFMS